MPRVFSVSDVEHESERRAVAVDWLFLGVFAEGVFIPLSFVVAGPVDFVGCGPSEIDWALCGMAVRLADLRGVAVDLADLIEYADRMDFRAWVDFVGLGATVDLVRLGASVDLVDASEFRLA